MPLGTEVMGLADVYVDAWFAPVYAMGIDPDATPEVMAARAALRSRLTALETELEGYRKREALWQLTTTAQEQGEYQGVGRSEGGASLRRRAGGLVLAVQPEGTASTIAQPSDLAASHPLHPEPVPVSSSGSALPCTSEYVNAQSGYDGEQGG